MFMGEFQHGIDNKGRFIIPAKFREDLGDCFVLTKGLENCLFAYPMEQWALVETKLRQLSFTKANARAFSRLFFSGAAEIEIDKQGRALLPMNLRQYANLDKDITVIGVDTRIEIWDKDAWLAYSQKADIDYSNIAEDLMDFDL